MWQLNNLRLGKSLSSSGFGVTAGNPSLNLNFLGTSTLNPLVTFTRASSGTYFDSTGTLQTAGNNTARFDYNPSTLASRGLLIEEQRTNSIRNNTMQGAVAGTPGTLPTNWAFGATAGLTTSVVGTGTESGITYVDVKLNGTTTGTNSTLRLESLNQQAASSGQTWTGSSYIRLVGGSITNVTSVQITIFCRDSTNTTETEAFSSSDVKGSISGALSGQRTSVTGTLASASTAFICERLALGFTNTAAVDITLRIGLPQLEQGAFATSVISTSTAAATRSADVASVNTLSPWYNASAGTLYVDALLSRQNTLANNKIANLIGSGSTEIKIFMRASGATGMSVIDSGGTTLADFTGAVIAANGANKTALAYSLNDFAGTTNGASVSTDTSGTPPTATSLDIGNSGILCGWIRRITYYPRRLSNAALQSLTA